MRRIAESRWRYLPLDAPAVIAPALAAALRWALIGLLGLAAVSVLAGLLVEQGLVPGVELATGTDLVGRGLLGGTLVLGPVMLLAWALLASLRGPLAARSLARSADRGADPADVPARGQWARAGEDSASVLRKMSTVLLWLLGVLLVLVALTALVTWDETGLILAAVTAAAVAVAVGGMWLGKKVIPAWHSRSLTRIREHWTTQHRVIANGRELTGEGGTDDVGTMHGGTARQLEKLFLAVLGAAAAIGLGALQLALALLFPDRQDWPGGQAGERAELGPAGEASVDLLTLVLALAAGVVLLSLALAVACEGVARSQRHRVVKAALTDQDAARPPLSLLRAPMDDGMVPFLRVLAVIGGAVLGFGWSLWFIARVADSPDWSSYSAASDSLLALGQWGPWFMLAGIGLLVLVAAIGAVLEVRDRRLRDRIVQRWPVGPAPRA